MRTINATRAASLAAAVLGLWLPSAPASACSCESVFGYAVWPRDGATDVPRDTPIVIDRQRFDGAPSDVQIVLENAQGDRIALEETRVLPSIAAECAFQETVFLRPAQPLDAGAQYTLSYELEGNASPALASHSDVFTVGAAMFDASAMPIPEVTYLHVAAETLLSAIGEVLLALDEPVRTPYWLAIESNAASDARNRVTLLPSAWFSTPPSHDNAVQASVMLPNDDPCVRISVYGLDATVLFEEQRCAPNSCAIFSERGLRVPSSCGDPPSSSLDAARVPYASCDDPYVVPHDAHGNAAYEDGGVAVDEPDAATEPDSGLNPVPSEDAGTHDDAALDTGGSTGADDESSGCGVRATSSKSSTPYAWLAIAALAWRRRRAPFPRARCRRP
jgi:MYXO-CTERM domain-containing protein